MHQLLRTSFPTLFQMIDRHDDHDAGRLTPAQQDKVVDECLQCKLCYLNCPYIPEVDERAIDFPRLMLRADAMRHTTGQVCIRGRVTDKVLGHIDRVGKAERRSGASCDLVVEGSVDDLGPTVDITVYRVVQEALSNVAQHAQARRVSVTLTRSAEMLSLRIRDDGRGFDPGVRTRGVGLLGMAERAAALGARVVTTSAPGAGTALCMTRSPAPGLGAFAGWRMTRILLVDDHPVVRAGYQRLLEQDGNATVVAQAGSVDEAWARYRHCVPELTITDIAMPGSGGLELLRRVKEVRPDARVLLFSMHDSEMIVRRGFSLGASGLHFQELFARAPCRGRPPRDGGTPLPEPRPAARPDGARRRGRCPRNADAPGDRDPSPHRGGRDARELRPRIAPQPENGLQSADHHQEQARDQHACRTRAHRASLWSFARTVTVGGPCAQSDARRIEKRSKSANVRHARGPRFAHWVRKHRFLAFS